MSANMAARACSALRREAVPSDLAAALRPQAPLRDAFVATFDAYLPPAGMQRGLQ